MSKVATRLLAVTLLGALALASLGCNNDSQAPLPALESSKPARPAATTPPPPANAIVTAMGLMKDPFRYQGALVVLAVSEDMDFDDGSFGEQSGMPGIGFDRMIAKDIAIYNVLRGNAEHRYNSRYDSTVGQIAIVLPDGSHVPLDRDRRWNVEPMGMTDGTNAYGATIQIPTIRFWGYAN